MSGDIAVGEFAPCTEAMGPGKRACTWVAGCPFRCKGCMTPELLEQSSGSRISVEAHCARIADAVREYGITGVSFSGGDPFMQAPALARVAAYARGLGLGTLSWSGYTLGELRGARAPAGAEAFLAQLDVLIDGRYVERMRCGNPYRGSENQRIVFLTDTYGPDDFADAKVELTVRDGGASFYGVTDVTPVKIMLQLLGG